MKRTGSLRTFFNDIPIGTLRAIPIPIGTLRAIPIPIGTLRAIPIPIGTLRAIPSEEEGAGSGYVLEFSSLPSWEGTAGAYAAWRSWPSA